MTAIRRQLVDRYSMVELAEMLEASEKTGWANGYGRHAIAIALLSVMPKDNKKKLLGDTPQKRKATYNHIKMQAKDELAQLPNGFRY